VEWGGGGVRSPGGGVTSQGVWGEGGDIYME